MSDVNQPSIEIGQIIPAFTLPGADGMPYSPWDYTQRENLVLLFIPNPTTVEARGLLRTFAQRYGDFREGQCAILAITAATVIDNLRAQEELHLPFALLADPKGTVFSCYTRRNDATGGFNPSIVLADRYGALYRQWVAENEVGLPPVEELLDLLRYLNQLCTP